MLILNPAALVAVSVFVTSIASLIWSLRRKS